MHLRRPLRRSLALTAGTVVLAAPLLTACGFDYATDREYTPAVGTQNRDEDIDVLNAVIVSAHEGSGTFAAGLSNSTEEDVELTRLSSTGDIEADFEPVEVPGRGFVNLAEEAEVHVTGEFSPGEVVELTLEFGDGTEVDIKAPVVTNCDEFEGVDTSEGTGPEHSCEIAEPAGDEGDH